MSAAPKKEKEEENIELSKEQTQHEENSGILDWEKSLSELEKIVKEFETDKLSLNESMKKFERGVFLYKNCKGALTDIEKKIKVLTDTLKEDDFGSST